MSLTAREQFKFGFLKACAERGMTDDEMHEVVKAAISAIEADALQEKQAIIDLTKVPGLSLLGKGIEKGIGTTFDLGKWIAQKGLLATAVAPIGIGGAAGYALGRSRGAMSDMDIDEVKREELATAYRRAARHLQQQNELAQQRDRHKQRPVRALV